jgi:hypothetical protein
MMLILLTRNVNLTFIIGESMNEKQQYTAEYINYMLNQLRAQLVAYELEREEDKPNPVQQVEIGNVVNSSIGIGIITNVRDGNFFVNTQQVEWVCQKGA